ncbi:MAG: hypothetical protein CO137_00165 [Candidatus Magasanikbacteria bacterium CG_4_9_14_3_um_filter_32_9]|uniref:Type 4 fimbrial biogenesis protein PilX N-terminal domain-containing protein n=1 Tax=Candidatus Magasanikbacteria bacterium CG_4_9_14_3_um_filter_32_9 TaxID=1974644 RepID=A0A2M7Z7U9_9BACT|nr:MAG: hypothetical protein CO137_00165 [Candidatus Magasanikbacteria bacterium CG_4_9_14_3_um_filter_32_9]
MKKLFMVLQLYENRGFVTLISVLTLGAVSLSIVLALLFLGTDYTRTNIDTIKFSQAKYGAETCAEEALERIRDSIPYTGTDTLILNDGTCILEVISTGGENRTIKATGVIGNSTRKIRITINQITPIINITSWEELADF